ncbi:hypothetical protein MTF65_14815 [Streptomyces sp. APSN-46.1]|uniref:hypothetical protein n=1 Tax=Streptomyces sp. APSN-46.1 TaxID=2929049 RepID=UPI001FB3FADE|nr:hypothetical protein [Streptomyces sp. APSN-46.1]MCJ1678598.1 hypothetical protein [Streptomyces sp. APSN-46.1]
MRKLRKAVLVAAMIGSLGVVGAGVATADGTDTNGAGRECTQAAAASNSSYTVNVPVNVAVSVFGDVTQSNTLQSNSTQSNSLQQICINGDNSSAANVSSSEVTQSNVFAFLDGF